MCERRRKTERGREGGRDGARQRANTYQTTCWGWAEWRCLLHVFPLTCLPFFTQASFHSLSCLHFFSLPPPLPFSPSLTSIAAHTANRLSRSNCHHHHAHRRRPHERAARERAFGRCSKSSCGSFSSTRREKLLLPWNTSRHRSHPHPSHPHCHLLVLARPTPFASEIPPSSQYWAHCWDFGILARKL